MKKISWALMCFVMLFTASCTNDDFSEALPERTQELKSNHFYGVKQAPISTKGVAQKDKLWYNGTTIKVKFLNGSEAYQQKVKGYAAEWEKYANIKFDFVETGKAQVRIGFDWNDERYITWSYIGTDCKAAPQSEATMSFAYWDSSSEQEMKADVLRAFGQVLGLELEHRHLEFNAGWTARIADYWEGEIEDIPWDELQEYVFDPLEANNVIETKVYDENSIMVWPFARKYAANTARDFNYELSGMDIEFVKGLYPKADLGELIMTLTVDKLGGYQFIGFHSYVQEDIIVDWGNGVVENIASSSGLQFINHEFGGDPTTESPSFVVKVYGSTKALLSLDFGLHIPAQATLDVSRNEELESLHLNTILLNQLDVSKNTKLKHLNLSYTGLQSLDISKNSNLQELYCTGNQLGVLDVSNNVQLTKLSCGGNMFTTLDISKNVQLVDLYCEYSQFTYLDVSNNVLLENLYCSESELQQLDVSKNTKLKRLDCHSTPITRYNRDASLALINSLPDRTGQVETAIVTIWVDVIGEEDPGLAAGLIEIGNAKNWSVH